MSHLPEEETLANATVWLVTVVTVQKHELKISGMSDFLRIILNVQFIGMIVMPRHVLIYCH